MPCSHHVPAVHQEDEKPRESPENNINVSIPARLHPLSLSQNAIPARHKCFRYLCGSDGLAETGTTLPRVEAELLTVSNLLRLLDNLIALGEDQLDVAGARHVGVDLKKKG